MSMQTTINPLQRTLDLAALLGLAFYVFYMVTVWPGLPERIPTHFNSYGQPDAYGSKYSLLILPVLSIGIYFLFTFLNRRPNTFNYPVQITDENRDRQYRLAREMMSFLKVSIIYCFLYITWRTVLTARGEAEGLGSLFLPIFLALTVLPAIIYFVIASRHK